MKNMAVIRRKAELFQETEQFADIVNAIGEQCGVPLRICITENRIECKGNSLTKNMNELVDIFFSKLGYRDLKTEMTKGDETYNEVCLVAFSLFDFYKKEAEKSNINYSYTFPVAEGVIGLPSKNESEWSITFRKEQMKGEKSWVTYAVLGVFLGAYGVHNFYAGQKKKGIIKLIGTCTLIGAPFTGLWALIEAYKAYQNKAIPED